MRLTRAVSAFLAALWLAIGAPVALAMPGDWTTYAANNIGTPTLLGSNAAGNPATSVAITTSAPSPGGNANLVIGLYEFGLSHTVTDQVSNTYSNGVSVSSYGAFYVASGTALPSGDTITISGSGGTSTGGWFVAITVSGINTSTPLDNNGTVTGGTSTSPSATEGTVTNPNRLVCGMEYSGQNGVTSEPSGWTSEGTSPGVGGKFLHVACKNVTGNASAQTYSPTLGSSIAWTAATVSFQSR